MSTTVRLLGIGGAQIQFGDFSIFIDAFNEYTDPPRLSSKDIILFSHGDGDHFNAQKTLGASDKNEIIGPPGIAYPLLAGTGLDPERLKIVYPPNLNSPVELEIDQLKIKVYQTKHFIDWEPDHISFLLKCNGKKIYFTGDSHMFYFDDPEIYDADALICSLIIKDVVMGKMSSEAGAKLHIPELKDIQKALKPKMVIGNHLIDCGWAVKTADMKREIEEEGMKDIVIPESDSEKILI